MEIRVFFYRIMAKVKFCMFIRKAKWNDVSKLAEIHVLAWKKAYSGDMPIEFLNNLSIDKRISDWEGWLREPGPGTTLVVENSEEVIGFCVFGPSRDKDAIPEHVGEILALNIHPKLWRCGYGRFLCKEALSIARQRKWKSQTLWTLKSNENAKLFYQSLGFECDGLERMDSISEDVSVEEVRYFKTL